MYERRNPAEILDHIASFINEPKDLLAFVLTSKWHHTCLSQNLEFSYIRCCIFRGFVWSTFTDKPGLARWVKRLELMSGWPTHSERLPESLITSEDKPALMHLLFDKDEPRITQEVTLIQQLLGAVKNMHNLSRLSWPRKPLCIENIYLQRLFYEEISRTCPRIEDITLYFDEPCVEVERCLPSQALHPEPRCDVRMKDLTAWPFLIQNLTKMTITLRLKHENTDGFTHFFEVLGSSTNKLEYLFINFQTVSATIPSVAFPSNAHWPNLVHLGIVGQIAGLYTHGPQPGAGYSISDFLERCSNVRSLCLGTSGRDLIKASVVFPNLTSMSFTSYAWGLGDFPAHQDILSRLDYLEVSFTSMMYMIHVFRYGTSLKTLVLSTMEPLAKQKETICELAKVIPGLQRFVIKKSSSRNDGSEPETININFALSKLAFLSAFHELTHLAGVWVEIKHRHYKKFSKLLEAFTGCTKLKYIEVMDGDTDVVKWVEIQRDEEDNYSGWHYAPFTQEIDREAWRGMRLPGY